MPTTVATITSLTKNLFKHLGLDQIKAAVSPQDESFQVNLQVAPEESGVLIGYHGETISGLQLILSLMAHKQLGAWHRLVININDYRQKREQALVDMAHGAAEQAKTTGQEVVMPPMASFDRRLIHMALAENKDVRTESVGEGRDRRLIIYPASSQSSS